ncbi:conserved hypothetical protein [Ricinus communis]|uniref:Uncharacterized protein n=1 Tax=Ricinus communis TaxID=3988 RepID=B9S413_RICCO|nr:conserved hypothetical protein [Ricinus communis]
METNNLYRDSDSQGAISMGCYRRQVNWVVNKKLEGELRVDSRIQQGGVPKREVPMPTACRPLIQQENNATKERRRSRAHVLAQIECLA